MRLTEKVVKVKETDPLDNPKGFVLTEIEYISDDTKCMKNKYINKLGQLEDIEEELGIDLITFFKIYNADKVYIKGKDYYWKIRHYNRHSISVGTNKIICLPFKDYGKTWALTKEELL